MTMTRPAPAFGKFTAYLAFAGVVVGIDQLTKYFARTTLPGKPAVEILPFLDLVLVFNPGAAFGFLSDAGGWQHYFFVCLAAAISTLLVGWLWRAHRQNALLSWGLALVLGGALGNCIDRVNYAHVIDFILLHYQNWYFPAFNIADGAITLGALALIRDSLVRRTDPPADG